MQLRVALERDADTRGDDAKGHRGVIGDFTDETAERKLSQSFRGEGRSLWFGLRPAAFPVVERNLVVDP